MLDCCGFMFRSRRCGRAARPISPTCRSPRPARCRAPRSTSIRATIRDLAFSIIRVLNRNGEAVGPWAGLLSDEELLEGLRHMMTLRTFDTRMQMAQRQGKTSFYMQHLGEEAVSCAFRKALRPGDMNFPTYRQAGLLIADGYPMVTMMNQIYSNESRSAEGPAAADHVFLEGARLLLDLRQSGDAVHPGGRLGDGLGDQRATPASPPAWIGDGSTAESDFHAALVFASTYKAPVILNVVNNQWAISTFQGIARGGSGTFAARGLGFGIPALQGRRQRLPRRPCGRQMGGGARAPQSRADADRICHLPRRRAFDLGRSLGLPAENRIRRLAARRSGRQAEEPSHPARRAGRRSATPRPRRKSSTR